VSKFLKIPLLKGAEQPKNSPKKSGNALSNALLVSKFQKFAAGAGKTIKGASRSF